MTALIPFIRTLEHCFDNPTKGFSVAQRWGLEFRNMNLGVRHKHLGGSQQLQKQAHLRLCHLWEVVDNLGEKDRKVLMWQESR